MPHLRAARSGYGFRGEKFTMRDCKAHVADGDQIMTAQARPYANESLVQLRYIALVEGVSYLLLVFVGMPLKYGFHIPQVNRVLGMVHGLLTLIFVAALLRAHFECRWSFKRSGLALFASLVPFGAIWLDRTLKEEMASPPRG